MICSRACGMCLSRLEFEVLPTPIFTIIFSQAPQNKRDRLEFFIMLGKAFCGNGFIHLNIAEIYEDNIGGQKKRAPIVDQGSKCAISSPVPFRPMNFLNEPVALETSVWRTSRITLEYRRRGLKSKRER